MRNALGFSLLLSFGGLCYGSAHVDESSGATDHLCVASESTISYQDALSDLHGLARRILEIHPDPNWVTAPGQFEKQSQRLIEQLQVGTHCPASIAWVASKMLALVNDGHSRLHNRVLREVFGDAPFRVQWQQDQLTLTAVKENNSRFLGSAVTHINGYPVSEITEGLRDLVPHDLEPEFLRFSERYYHRPVLMRALAPSKNSDMIELTLSPAGETVGFRTSDMPLAWKTPDQKSETAFQKAGNVWYSEGGDYFVMKLLAFADSDDSRFLAGLSQAFEAFDASNATVLLIDLRDNGGGNGIYGLPIASGISARPTLLQPGKVVVVANKYTYSAAVTTLQSLFLKGNATLVGESPGNRFGRHPGDNKDFVLPHSKILAEISSVLHESPFLRPSASWNIAIPIDNQQLSYGEIVERSQTSKQLPISTKTIEPYLGRYAINSVFDLELIDRDGFAWLKIAPEVDLPLFQSAKANHLTTRSGLKVVLAEGEVSLELRDDILLRLKETKGMNPWSALQAGDYETGGQLLREAKVTSIFAKAMTDASLTSYATQIYFDARAMGVERAKSAAMARTVLEAAQQINQPSPSADFAIRFYQ